MDTGLGTEAGRLLARYGERWQISQEGRAWVAVRRPTPTAQTVHVGHTPAELAAKLDAEEQP